MRHVWRYALGALAAVFLLAGVPTQNTVAVVANTADLRNTPTQAAASGIVWRATDGDAGAPPLPYAPDTGHVCSQDDGGNCVAAPANSTLPYWLATWPNGQMDLRQWGIPSSTHLTAAIAAACAMPNGATIIVPAVTLTTTVTINCGQITLQGINSRGSTITCQTGAADCIDATGTSVTAQIYGVFLRNLHFYGSTMTAGNAVSFRFVAQSGLEHVVLDKTYAGYAGSGTNDIRLRDVFIIANGGVPLRWYSSVAGERSDVLSLDHVTLTEAVAGTTDCAQWQDYTETLNINNTNMLNCNIGLHGMIVNGNNVQSPQFLQANNLAIDTAAAQAIKIDGYAQQWWVLNSQLTNASGAGVAAVDVGGQIDMAGFIGDRIRGATYGLSISAGATRVLAVGDNFNGSGTGAVSDATGNALVVGGVDYNGVTLGSTNNVNAGGVGSNPGMYFSRPLVGGNVASKIINATTGAGTNASDIVSTGTPNSFAQFQLRDNAGAPQLWISGGAAVTQLQIDSSANANAPLVLKAGSAASIQPLGIVNLGGVSGGGTATKYVCVDASNNLVVSAAAC